MRLEAIQEALLSVVPTGKALAWIVVTAASMFMAGIGWMSRASEYAELPDDFMELRLDVDANTTSISSLRVRLDSLNAGQAQMICLITLTATNPRMTPFEVRQRCP